MNDTAIHIDDGPTVIDTGNPNRHITKTYFGIIVYIQYTTLDYLE